MTQSGACPASGAPRSGAACTTFASALRDPAVSHIVTLGDVHLLPSDWAHMCGARAGSHARPGLA